MKKTFGTMLMALAVIGVMMLVAMALQGCGILRPTEQAVPNTFRASYWERMNSPRKAWADLHH